MKEELIRAGVMILVIGLEWYMMQPYREPVVARFWEFIARLARRIAYRAGRIALHAEHSYYIAAEAGL